MLGSPLLTAYLVVISLSLEGLALLLYLLDHPHPQMRPVAVTSGAGAVTLACALWWRVTRLRRRRVKHSRVCLLRDRG